MRVERPEDQELAGLLADSQRRLAEQLEAAEQEQDRQDLIERSLAEAEDLESRGLLGEALDRLQTVMARDPSNRRALEIQDRVLAAQAQAEREDANLARVAQLLDLYDGSITPQGVMSLTLRVEDESEIMDETILILKELSSI